MGQDNRHARGGSNGVQYTMQVTSCAGCNVWTVVCTVLTKFGIKHTTLGLTYAHPISEYMMKETEWGKTIDTRSGSTGCQYK